MAATEPTSVVVTRAHRDAGFVEIETAS